MNRNFNPTMASPILEPVFLSPPGLLDSASQPVLDETGNPVRDEKGNEIHES